jgi:MFS family permease
MYFLLRLTKVLSSLTANNSVGFLTMMIPLYQAEICHPKIRGRVTALQQFMLGVGALCASWISYGTYVNFSGDNDAQWQLPLGIQLVPAVFLGLLIMFFPEVCLGRFPLRGLG